MNDEIQNYILLIISLSNLGMCDEEYWYTEVLPKGTTVRDIIVAARLSAAKTPFIVVTEERRYGILL
jgi:hypothetical protein